MFFLNRIFHFHYIFITLFTPGPQMISNCTTKRQIKQQNEYARVTKLYYKEANKKIYRTVIEILVVKWEVTFNCPFHKIKINYGTVFYAFSISHHYFLFSTYFFLELQHLSCTFYFCFQFPSEAP